MSNLARCYSCMANMDAGSACPSCGWQPGSEPDSPLYLPQGYVLNSRYLIGKVIGVGGFGIVYVAWDNNLDVRVAIKEFLAKDYAARSTDHISLTVYSGSAREEHTLGIEKFIEEAKALAKFQDHPGIVKVNESFRANNTAYMVMQFLDGMTLKEYLKRQPGEKMPFNMAVKAMIPIMDALREVHSAGFVHRDISPDNIFITRQKQIKLLDFGSARYAIGEHSKSLTSVLKHGYAPVEQYSSKGNQGPWSDVYAVAATMYRCVTGQPPTDAMERIQEDTLMSPRQLGVDIPLAGESAMMRGLALRANERYVSIQQFQQALTSEEMASPIQDPVIEPNRPQQSNVIECPECGAKNQLNPGDDPKALRCGKCKRELAVNVPTSKKNTKEFFCSKCKTSHVFDGGDLNAAGNKEVFFYCTSCNSKNYFENTSKISLKEINHKYYSVAVIGGCISIFLSSLIEKENKELAAFGYFAFVALWGFAYIYHFIALHRCWAILQGSTGRTTPSSAVVRMFIPFYNIYWIFIAYKGLAEDCNQFSNKYGLKRTISVGFSTGFCITCLVPYLNITIAPLLFSVVIYQWSKFNEEVSGKWADLHIETSKEPTVSSSNSIFAIIAALFGGVAIIGILAAIAIPQFSAYRTKAYNSAAVSDLKNLKTGAEAYFADNLKYPQSISDLNIVKSEGVELNYEPECKQLYDYSTYRTVTSCEKYVISATHSNGDKIFATTSDAVKIYFRLKSDPNNKFITLE